MRGWRGSSPRVSSNPGHHPPRMLRVAVRQDAETPKRKERVLTLAYTSSPPCAAAIMRKVPRSRPQNGGGMKEVEKRETLIRASVEGNITFKTG